MSTVVPRADDFVHCLSTAPSTPCPDGDERPEARLTAITRLTVASLNLHLGLGWLGDPFDVAAAITGLDAAVICLQEVWLPQAQARAAGGGGKSSDDPVAGGDAVTGDDAVTGSDAVDGDDAVAEAAKSLGATLYRVVQRSGMRLAEFGLTEAENVEAGPTGSGSGDLCLAVLTTLPVTAYEVRPLGRALADHMPRLAQVICVRVADEVTIRIVNTHLTHRLTSPVQLGRLWRSLRTDLEPTIIAGDLNMPRIIAARLAGFSPAVTGRTFPAWQPLMQLDHLLVSDDLTAVAGSVLTSAGSDHLPVRATIAVSANSSPAAVLWGQPERVIGP
ncbi:MAG TPA: endonuclease/exonuclease/phosphatase family protein [Streptosporangiaceae bacterium]|jgi:endonuclease/exonuclease/phosphatase family metal-dependent hydrolase